MHPGGNQGEGKYLWLERPGLHLELADLSLDGIKCLGLQGCLHLDLNGHPADIQRNG